MRSANGRLKALAVPLLFAALAAGMWVHRVYLDEPQRPPTFGYLDVFRHAYPTAVFLHDELRRGNLPLWNPYQMAGQPFVALHVTAALYPPNLLLTGLLSPARALEAITLFHFVVAGFFTWLLAARLGLCPAARLAAAVGYMFSGALLAGIYMVPCLAAQCWLPAILWALHGLLTEVRPRWAVGLAIFFGLSFLAGYAQATYYEFQLALVYGLVGLFVLTPRELRLRVLGLTAASGILAFGLCAPQLLPSLELTQLSVRGLEALTLGQASLGGASRETLLKGLFSVPEPALHLKSAARGVTLPMLSVPLLLSGLLARRLRSHWIFFLCAAVVAALFALGPEAPVFEFFYALPLGKTFRSPAHMGFVYVFVASILAGIGIQGILERLRESRADSRIPAAVAAILALLVVVDVYARSPIVVPPPVTWSPTRGGPRELIDFLRGRPGRERVFIQVQGFPPNRIMHKVGMMNGIFAVPDYESNMPLAYQRFLTGGSFPIWHGYLSLGHSKKWLPKLRSLDLMSVRYYAATHPSHPRISKTLERVTGRAGTLGQGYELFERTAALPRAYVVNRVDEAPSSESALIRIGRNSFSPRFEAVVVRGGSEELALPNGGGAAGRAEIVRYETEQVEIEAECGSACLLVLTDLDYPGWRVQVDGSEAVIHNTNGLFRGVLLASGSHRVIYRYEPASFRTGILLLLASLVVGSAGLLGLGRVGVRAR